MKCLHCKNDTFAGSKLEWDAKFGVPDKDGKLVAPAYPGRACGADLGGNVGCGKDGAACVNPRCSAVRCSTHGGK